MKKGLTELVFILDRSGSMAPLAGDTIGGFNSMISRQQKEDGECLVSTVLFANESKTIHDRIPLSEVPELTDRDYYAGGTSSPSTATPGRRTSRKRRSSSSRPTASKTPAIGSADETCGSWWKR